MLDFGKLSAELRSGLDAHGLGRAGIREFRRLEALGRRVLGPALRN